MHSSVTYLIRCGKIKVIEVAHMLGGAIKNGEKIALFSSRAKGRVGQTNVLENRECEFSGIRSQNIAKSTNNIV